MPCGARNTETCRRKDFECQQSATNNKHLLDKVPIKTVDIGTFRQKGNNKYWILSKISFLEFPLLEIYLFLVWVFDICRRI